MNLGTKPETGKDAVPVPASPGEYYPSFTLSDKLAEEFLEQFDLKVGEGGEACIHFKLCGMSDQQYGKSVTIEIHELTGDDEESEHEKPTYRGFSKKLMAGMNQE